MIQTFVKVLSTLTLGHCGVTLTHAFNDIYHVKQISWQFRNRIHLKREDTFKKTNLMRLEKEQM